LIFLERLDQTLHGRPVHAFEVAAFVDGAMVTETDESVFAKKMDLGKTSLRAAEWAAAPLTVTSQIQPCW
jgi:hypothetical protein